MKTNRKVKFKEWNCLLNIGQYHNGRIALWLTDKEDHSNIATATVNLPDNLLQEGYVHVKEWSENKGMTQALVDAGVVKNTGLRIPVGPYGSYATLCKLLIENEKDSSS